MPVSVSGDLVPPGKQQKNCDVSILYAAWFILVSAGNAEHYADNYTLLCYISSTSTCVTAHSSDLLSASGKLLS